MKLPNLRAVPYFALCALLACLNASAKDPVELKEVPLSTFIGKELRSTLPDTTLDIPIPVIAEYEHGSFDRAPGKSYWMQPSDIPVANKTGDLSGKNGNMVGFVDTKITYTKEGDIFRGINDPGSQEATKAVFPDWSPKLYHLGNRAVALVAATDAKSGTHIYAAYIAASSESGNVVFIAFRPQGNSREIGDFVWNKFRSILEDSTRSYSAIGHDASADNVQNHGMGEQSFSEESIESQGARDADVAGAVEAVVKTARSLGFYYDASKSRDGEVVVRAKWKGKMVTLTTIFHRRSGALYVLSKTDQGADTFLNGGGKKIEQLFYGKLHEETDRRKLKIYSDPAF